MTFVAPASAFADAVEIDFAQFAAARSAFPAHCDVGDPEPGWASRHPGKALAFLFVSPRDCGAVDELMAL
jgi:hypothetical protein